MVTLIPLLIAATAAGGGTSVALALLPVLLGGGLLGAVVTYRAQNRKTNADATAILQETYQEGIQDLRGQMAELRDDARGARAEAAAARASAAAAKEEATRAVLAQQRAETRSAELEAEVARAEQRAGEERHKLRNELAAVAASRDALKYEMEQMRSSHDAAVAGLRAEIETLRARLGLYERRTG